MDLEAFSDYEALLSRIESLRAEVGEPLGESVDFSADGPLAKRAPDASPRYAEMST